jgi:hypothetical protein
MGVVINGYKITRRDLEESSTTFQQLAEFLNVSTARIYQLLGNNPRHAQRWRGDQYERAKAFLNMRRQRFEKELQSDLIKV